MPRNADFSAHAKSLVGRYLKHRQHRLLLIVRDCITLDLLYGCILPLRLQSRLPAAVPCARNLRQVYSHATMRRRRTIDAGPCRSHPFTCSVSFPSQAFQSHSQNERVVPPLSGKTDDRPVYPCAYTVLHNKCIYHFSPGRRNLSRGKATCSFCFMQCALDARKKAIKSYYQPFDISFHESTTGIVSGESSANFRRPHVYAGLLEK